MGEEARRGLTVEYLPDGYSVAGYGLRKKTYAMSALNFGSEELLCCMHERNRLCSEAI